LEVGSVAEDRQPPGQDDQPTSIRTVARTLVQDLNDYEAHRHPDHHDAAECRQQQGHDPWTEIVLRGQGYRLAEDADHDTSDFYIEAIDGPGYAEIALSYREDGPGSRWEVHEVHDPAAADPER
jgi:hypothetical protein